MLRWLEFAWCANAKKLEKELNKNNSSYSYKSLLKLLINVVINPFIEKHKDKLEPLLFNTLTEIDNGDYQGTIIFIIPNDTYQPSLNDYYVTYVSYGSCSSCDTLQSANEYPKKETRVLAYKEICLHMLQNMTKLSGLEGSIDEAFNLELKEKLYRKMMKEAEKGIPNDGTEP